MFTNEQRKLMKLNYYQVIIVDYQVIMKLYQILLKMIKKTIPNLKNGLKNKQGAKIINE